MEWGSFIYHVFKCYKSVTNLYTHTTNKFFGCLDVKDDFFTNGSSLQLLT